MKIRVDFEHYTFANNPLGEATVPKFIFLCQCCVCVLTVTYIREFLRIIGIIWGNLVGELEKHNVLLPTAKSLRYSSFICTCVAIILHLHTV